MLREMCKRYNEYVSPLDVRIAVGTYNVNGGKHFRSVVYKDVSLSDWLLDSHHLARSRCNNFCYFFFLINVKPSFYIALVDVTHPEDENQAPIDIFAVGFQEIVDLNASNIVAAR